MMLLLVVGPMLLPGHRGTPAERLDLPSAALLTAAREAFTSGTHIAVVGTHIAVVMSDVLLIGVAILVVTVLRHVRLSGEAQPNQLDGMPHGSVRS